MLVAHDSLKQNSCRQNRRYRFSLGLHLGVDAIFGSSLLLFLILSILVQGSKKRLSGRLGQVDFYLTSLVLSLVTKSLARASKQWPLASKM